jgi:hypothetical protein
MASGTPAKVRLTAREGSVLYHLQLEFNKLVDWSATHVHNGAFTNPGTPALRGTVSMLTGPDGKEPDGSDVPAAWASNIIRATARRFRPVSFEYEFIGIWNVVVESVDLHAHSGGAGTGPTGGTPERNVVNLEGRDPRGTVKTINITNIREGRALDSDESELRFQWNQWMAWFYIHTHSALGGVSTTQPTTVSKIAGLEGRDVAGVVVVA